jgi:hypothetical protein
MRLEGATLAALYMFHHKNVDDLRELTRAWRHLKEGFCKGLDPLFSLIDVLSRQDTKDSC